MTVNLSSFAGAGWQFFNNDGVPLSGGLIYSYLAGSTTPAATYTTNSGLIANSNPIVLDSAGRTPQEIWLLASQNYKFVLKDSGGNLIGTYDNIEGINNAQALTTLSNTTVYPPGDALVGFRQSKSYAPAGFVTGSVGKTVNDKLQEVVSVLDFGAKGDGVTDDTVAIQNAINYVCSQGGGGMLYVPPNQPSAFYKITAPLVITNRCNIFGPSYNGATILAVGLTHADYILDYNCAAASVIEGMALSNITLRADGLPNGIRFKNVSYANFFNVQLYNVYYGMKISGTRCFTNNFTQLTCYGVNADGVIFEAGFTGGGQFGFFDCTFSGNNGFVVQATAATDSLSFVNCNWEQCIVTSFYIGGSCNGLSFFGCRTEGLNGGADFLIRPEPGDNVYGVAVTGCTFTTDAGASYPISLGGSGGKVRGFSITGNNVAYAGNPYFVQLNGDGESGIISGNYLTYSTSAASAQRPGVIVFGNENASGKLPEWWGQAPWGVENGTWTPTDASGAGLSFTVTQATYSKVGRLVTITANIVFPSTANASAIQIGGLPFALATGIWTAALNTDQGGTFNTVLMNYGSGQYLYIRNSSNANPTNTNFSTKYLAFSITYATS